MLNVHVQRLVSVDEFEDLVLHEDGHIRVADLGRFKDMFFVELAHTCSGFLCVCVCVCYKWGGQLTA